MRNYDSFPVIPEGDVDILVNQEDENVLLNIIKTVVQDLGGTTVPKFKAGYHNQIRALRPSEEFIECSIDFDVQTQIENKGISLIDSKWILSDYIEVINGYQVPRQVALGVMLLVHSIVDKEQFKEKYWETVITSYQQYKLQFEELLRKCVGIKLSTKMIKFLGNHNKGELIKLKKVILLYSLFRRRNLVNKIRYIFEHQLF